MAYPRSSKGASFNSSSASSGSTAPSATLRSSASQYPESAALLENYKLVTSGDYILFCIDGNADAMVEAFNTYAK